MSIPSYSPAKMVLEVYGIALKPDVAERLNTTVNRMLKRAASLLQQQPCEFDGFVGKDPDVTGA